MVHIPCSRGFKPRLHKINNKTSLTIKDFIKSQQTYTPPDMHRQNAAAWAIQTWKKYFIAGIAGTLDYFPLVANFCCLTKECNYMNNMLWPNQQNPKISTLEALWDTYSFDATPVAPPGTKCYVMYTLNQKNVPPGDIMPQMHGTLVPNLTNIDPMKSLYKKQEQSTHQIWPPSTTMPSPSHQFAMLTKSSRPPSISKM